MTAIRKATEGLQERLGVKGISLISRKLQALLADGVGPDHLTEQWRKVVGNTSLTVVRHGMRVMGVPVETKHFKQNFLQEVVNGEPSELVRARPDGGAPSELPDLASVCRLPPVTPASHSPVLHHILHCCRL